ncbi:hypothetical protein VNO77_03050 [Canavalia gladiata]|uniref:Uncharacterized protein n=1 Tax=Canavalia gladiata TaxID=3824 RepID=A0AAN9R6L0_CANGL
MSLNCLTCGQVLQRVKSDKESLPETKSSRRKAPLQVDRTWSGNISPSQSQYAGGAVAKIKTEHRRTNSAGDVGPRLLRSSGKRRDWSYEDLFGKQDIRCY